MNKTILESQIMPPKEQAWCVNGVSRMKTTKEKINDVRSHNVGDSDYSKHNIQPWDIWIEYKLNPFDADIIKRVLRHKKTDPRKLDYQKIIHICEERIRQIDTGNDPWVEDCSYNNIKE